MSNKDDLVALIESHYFWTDDETSGRQFDPEAADTYGTIADAIIAAGWTPPAPEKSFTDGLCNRCMGGTSRWVVCDDCWGP